MALWGSGGRPWALCGGPCGIVRLLGRVGLGFREFPGNSGRPKGSILAPKGSLLGSFFDAAKTLRHARRVLHHGAEVVRDRRLLLRRRGQGRNMEITYIERVARNMGLSRTRV